MDEELLVNVYTIKDIKANIYSPPITFDTTENLQQYLSVLVNTHGNGHYHLYPEDFIVLKVGQFDAESGEIMALKPEIVVNVAGLKKPCKYCEQPEEIANESVKVCAGSASKNATQ